MKWNKKRKRRMGILLCNGHLCQDILVAGLRFPIVQLATFNRNYLLEEEGEEEDKKAKFKNNFLEYIYTLIAKLSPVPELQPNTSENVPSPSF